MWVLRLRGPHSRCRIVGQRQSFRRLQSSCWSKRSQHEVSIVTPTNGRKYAERGCHETSLARAFGGGPDNHGGCKTRLRRVDKQLTLVKYEFTRTSAVFRSGSRIGTLASGERVVVASMSRWRLGSVVNWDGPSTLSTIIRMNWRYDNVAESPRYTAFCYQ